MIFSMRNDYFVDMIVLINIVILLFFLFEWVIDFYLEFCGILVFKFFNIFYFL